MNIFRGIVIILTQVPLILFIGAKFDLIFGFNRMDSGFGLLIFLFVFIPLLNLSWVITETIRSFMFYRHQGKTVTFSMPLIAVAFLIESLAIDLYIASHARM
jgi:hypothetical protein